jgi:hypothetical protein
MRNKALLLTNLLIAAIPTNVFAHTGEHHGNWLTNLLHYTISPAHLAMLIPTVIVLGLAIYGISKYAFYKRVDT